MARHKRFISQHNIYHIVLKGINANTIFYNDNDYVSFLKYFKEVCNNYNVELLAYCLMSNHIHLMLKLKEDNIAEMFKSFGARYVPKYNINHGRIGPLFNGRYYSSPINDEDYLLAVLRYIHFNPVNAGVANSLEEYKWCSYNEYLKHCSNICDVNYIESMFSKKELQMLHIIDDSVLDETFIINSRINGADECDIISFLNRNEKRNVEELIEMLKRAKVSKKGIAKALKIDRRKL